MVLKFYNRKIVIGSKSAPSKMAKAAKSTTLKAKTLIDAMQTLNLIPSFSTSNFGGDVLPENILIKNILGNFLSQDQIHVPRIDVFAHCLDHQK